MNDSLMRTAAASRDACARVVLVDREFGKFIDGTTGLDRCSRAVEQFAKPIQQPGQVGVEMLNPDDSIVGADFWPRVDTPEMWI